VTNEYVVQTAARQYVELFDTAFSSGNYTQFRAAVAYASFSGVHVLNKRIVAQIGSSWRRLDKRWLVGIDWCRSDPSALERLDAMPASNVRIPNGNMLVQTPGCRPRQPFHPKLFILLGSKSCAIICGSGNLSANGLTGGCECGSVFRFKSRVHPELVSLQRWFNRAWRTADRFDVIEAAYKARCDAMLRRGTAVPIEDDVPPPEPTARRTRGLTEQQLRQFRTYDNFWIEAGGLGSNLGPGIPGNQLDATRYTRVFFGAPATDIPPNEIIDHITLVWSGVRHHDRTLKFGDNGMDKLNVPPAGSRGRLFYRGKTLLFTRLRDGAFDFTVGDNSDRRTWRRRSQRLNAFYHVGPREWGLF
jgi:hypothetical protein